MTWKNCIYFLWKKYPHPTAFENETKMPSRQIKMYQLSCAKNIHIWVQSLFCIKVLGQQLDRINYYWYAITLAVQPKTQRKPESAKEGGPALKLQARSRGPLI